MSADKVPVWVDRRGRIIQIHQMESGHLKNTIDFLTRRGYTDHPSFKALVEEAEYRGIIPPADPKAAEAWDEHRRFGHLYLSYRPEYWMMADGPQAERDMYRISIPIRYNMVI